MAYNFLRGDRESGRLGGIVARIEEDDVRAVDAQVLESGGEAVGVGNVEQGGICARFAEHLTNQARVARVVLD